MIAGLSVQTTVYGTSYQSRHLVGTRMATVEVVSKDFIKGSLPSLVVSDRDVRHGSLIHSRRAAAATAAVVAAAAMIRGVGGFEGGILVTVPGAHLEWSSVHKERVEWAMVRNMKTEDRHRDLSPK